MNFKMARGVDAVANKTTELLDRPNTKESTINYIHVNTFFDLLLDILSTPNGLTTGFLHYLHNTG